MKSIVSSNDVFIHKNLFLLFLFSLIFLLLTRTFSQQTNDPITIGYYQKLHSDILGEDRMLSICLPDNYEKSNLSYPVVYHLYGDRIEQYFAEAVSVVNNLNWDGVMPEVILVGIDESNNRYRDLLPHQFNGDSTGIDDFMKLLKLELFPYVEQNFRTKDYRILVGPQVGANFGLYTLLTNSELFNAYIITNPFRWKKGRELLFDKLRINLSSITSLKSFLFITHDVADELEIEGNNYIKEFQKIISSESSIGLSVHYNFLDNDYDFNSRTGLEKGCRTLFKEFKIPESYEINSLLDLLIYYKNLSSKIGYVIDIPEMNIVSACDKLIEQNKMDRAFEMLNYLEKQFPNSANSYWRLGSIYKEQGENEKAIKYFKKVLELHPNMTMVQNIIKELEK